MELYLYDPLLEIKRTLEELKDDKGVIYLNRDFLRDNFRIALFQRVNDVENPRQYKKIVESCISSYLTTISRKHAEIKQDNERRVLRDLGSRNGTFLNNVQLGQDNTIVLNLGDRIRLAYWELKYLDERELKHVKYYDIREIKGKDF